MKKRIGTVLVCIVMLMSLMTISAGAAAVSTVSATISPDVTVQVDGVARTFFDATGRQVFPVAYAGTTYLPVRAIGELMGKNVDWNQSTFTITLSSPRTASSVQGTLSYGQGQQMIDAQLRPDFTIVVDGAVSTFYDANGVQVYPLLYAGTNYLPIRAIGQLMGKNVDWVQNTKTVTLSGSTGGLVTDADTFGGASGGTGNPGMSGDIGGSGGAGNTLIGEAKAQSIALNHAGLTAAQVTFVRALQDWENGRLVYDVEFYVASTYAEYDYEIDAYTGSIISFDYDAEYYTPPGTNNGGWNAGQNGNNWNAGQNGNNWNPGSTGTGIGVDAAQNAALNHAGLTASQVYGLHTEIDYEHGWLEYDVEFYYNGWEYSYEIDGTTGNIIKYEKDWD